MSALVGGTNHVGAFLEALAIFDHPGNRSEAADVVMFITDGDHNTGQLVPVNSTHNISVTPDYMVSPYVRVGHKAAPGHNDNI